MSELSHCDTIKHEIKVTSDVPIRTRYYKMDKNKEDILYKTIQEILDFDIIQKSKSPYASPYLLVAKKDGNFRVVNDYRKINEITIKDAMPMPRVQDILDLFARYYQILMDPE